MKKVMLLIGATMFALTSYAGAFNWDLDYDDYAMPNASVAYIVPVASTVTYDGIINHIKANGLDVAGLKDTAWAAVDGAKVNEDLVYLSNTDATPNVDWYVAIFILNADETEVVVANEINTVVPCVTGADNVGTPGTPEKYYWTADGDSALALTIPEPTVLALLALGVAGLALRRRA